MCTAEPFAGQEVWSHVQSGTRIGMKSMCYKCVPLSFSVSLNMFNYLLCWPAILFSASSAMKCLSSIHLDSGAAIYLDWQVFHMYSFASSRSHLVLKDAEECN